MNMPATLMWARGFDMRPVRVTFEPPASSAWKPATQLFPTEDPWTFTAPNLQYLMDSPTELSDYTLRSFKVRNPDGKEFTIRTAVHHDATDADDRRVRRGHREDRQRARRGLREFPEFDTGTYTFLGDYVPWGGGDGMEHRNSTVVAAPTSFKNPRHRPRRARTPCRTSSSTRGTSSASGRSRSSRSTSKRPTCPASCGWRKASRSTTAP